MALVGEIRSRARFVIGPVLGALLIGYFGYHALTGERSLTSLWRLTQHIEVARDTLAELVATRARLEHRVGLMQSDHIDPDMLDERVRWTLNLVHPDEIVILNPDTGNWR